MNEFWIFTINPITGKIIKSKHKGYAQLAISETEVINAFAYEGEGIFPMATVCESEEYYLDILKKYLLAQNGLGEYTINGFMKKRE